MPSRPMTASNRLRLRGYQPLVAVLDAIASVPEAPGGENGWNGVAATQKASKSAPVAG